MIKVAYQYKLLFLGKQIIVIIKVEEEEKS